MYCVRTKSCKLNSFLYNKCISASFPGSSGLCSNKANLCGFWSVLKKKRGVGVKWGRLLSTSSFVLRHCSGVMTGGARSS